MPDIANLLQRADQTAAVRNQLLRREHVAYCLAWQDLIGPQPTTLYNAMGPDISTVLMTTDAEHVIGVDPLGLDQEHLEFFIENGPDYFGWKAYKHSPEGYSYKDDPKILFENFLTNRKAFGYWHIDALKTYGLNRTILHELNCMGVNNSNINIYFEENITTLTLEWGLTPETKKERKITYFKDRLGKIFHNNQRFKNSLSKGLDCFYQKGFFEGRETSDNLRRLEQYFVSDSTILIGDIIENEYLKKEDYFRNIKDYTLYEIAKSLGLKSEKIQAPLSIFQTLVTTKYVDCMNYGMTLNGFRLIKK